jgi:hypothetical protein
MEGNQSSNRWDYYYYYQDELQDIHNVIMIGGWGCSQILQQGSAKLVPSLRPRSTCTEMLNPLAHIGAVIVNYPNSLENFRIG